VPLLGLIGDQEVLILLDTSRIYFVFCYVSQREARRIRRLLRNDPLAEFEAAQAEEAAKQHAILEFIQLEPEVVANRNYLRETDVDLEELFMDVESDEEPELLAAANDQEAGPSDTSGTVVSNISDNE
jgi:hypothetical protein